MSAIPVFAAKNPNDANLLLKFDFSAVLASSVVPGETLASVNSVNASGLTFGIPSLDSAKTSVIVPVSGGTAPADYLISVEVVTTGNQTLVRSATLPVRSN